MTPSHQYNSTRIWHDRRSVAEPIAGKRARTFCVAAARNVAGPPGLRLVMTKVDWRADSEQRLGIVIPRSAVQRVRDVHDPYGLWHRTVRPGGLEKVP